MSLPYPTKVVLPFDIATAQDMNERHANDVALAAGTGLDNLAVTTAKIDDAAVTASKIDLGSLFLGTGSITTNQTTSGTTKLTLTGSSTTVVAPGGCKFKFNVFIPLLSGTALGDRFIIAVEEGGVPVTGFYTVIKQTALGDTVEADLYTSSDVPAGSHTYTLTITREIGTGTASTNAAAAAAALRVMIAI